LFSSGEWDCGTLNGHQYHQAGGNYFLSHIL
jgi:hypothetical protein